MNSPFRDTFKIHGYRFGEGEKSIAIVGAMRGDEIQQQYICSQLVRKLSILEQQGKLLPDHEILIIPSANPFSMNIGKRFWAMDNTDINRMFPGYDAGETTQRIAAALFKALKGYKYGIQMASFYLPVDFVPHVRMSHTGYEDVDTATLFGLPYIYLHEPLPYDTTLLNYNWQIWETKAFSLYGGKDDEVGSSSCKYLIETVLRFMKRTGVIKHSLSSQPDYNSIVKNEEDIISVKSPTAGMINKVHHVNEEVVKGDVLARIIDPYEGGVISEIISPVDGIIFSEHNKPLALQNTTLFNIVEC